MANSNFIVQNGLTVGPYLVFAANGDVITSGNITTTGSGSISSANGFGGLNPSQIYSGSSNVTVTASEIFANISGTNQLAITSTGVTVIGNLTVQGTTTQVVNETVINQETANSIQISYITGNSSINSGEITATGTIIPSANATYNLGSTTAWFNQFYGVATHAYYADLAENYQADKAYQPGTVLMFGGVAEVTVADADTIRVAGVVSTEPATLMNGGLTGPNVVPVAFTGRVPCNVIGPVAKGDLMVSAGFGYAKVNNTPQIGQVIGKALQDFPVTAKGIIEVVVGRF